MFVTALATETTGVKGALNYDGVLNRKDYSLLSTYITHGSGNFELMEVDFNGDSVANDADKTDMLAAITANFDNNGDGKISTTDYHLLKKFSKI